MINDRFWDEIRLFDVSVISGVRSFGRSVDHQDHGRGRNGILYILNGEAAFFEGGVKKLTASGGTLTFLPYSKKYSMKYTAPSTTFVVVNFGASDASGEMLAPFDDISVLVREKEIGPIAKIMASFELCASSKNADAVFRKRELLYRLLGAVYRENSHLSAGDGFDLRIIDGVRLIEQSYLENLPVERFAAESHMSVSAFRKLFHDQFGVSPVKYRNRLRVERAKELLQDPMLTVGEVAYASGFENLGYFCRCFAAHEGESPTEARKRRQIKY